MVGWRLNSQDSFAAGCKAVTEAGCRLAGRKQGSDPVKKLAQGISSHKTAPRSFPSNLCCSDVKPGLDAQISLQHY